MSRADSVAVWLPVVHGVAGAPAPLPTHTFTPTATWLAPTETFTPTPTWAPPTATLTPTPSPTTSLPSFGTGTKLVGADIQPGTYRSGGDGCYWERLSGLGGTLGETIANSYADGPTIVTIESGDVAFDSRRCDTWVMSSAPITSDPNAPFGQGTFWVGVDVSPGLWRTENTDGCYWERLSGFGGTFADLIDNDYGDGSRLVEIAPSDTGFHSQRCGTWTKVTTP